MQLAKHKSEFDNSVFRKAAEHIHQKQDFNADMMADDPVRQLTAETNRVLSYAITEDVPDKLKQSLEQDIFIFSGFKTYHQLREVSAMLQDENGGYKPFEKFYQDVLKIHNTYNKNYLQAEYNFAVQSTQMAVKWRDFERDGERYLIQYRTAGDDKVRAEHAALHNVTLPVNDPFWDNYLPPLGWNCRCTAVQVLRNKYPISNSKDAIMVAEMATSEPKQKIFRFNPGKTETIFPPKHPYYKAPKEQKKVVEKILSEELKQQRINILREQLPSYLTDEEKDAIAAHNQELEKQLGITIGKPMTVEEADKQSANPNHGKSWGYSINCQTCAPAYALRLMGFNVTAKSNTPGSLSEYLSKQRSFEAWTNIDGSPVQPIRTYDWMQKNGYKRMTPARYKAYFEEACSETGVYILTIGWKGGGGHATILQRFENGELCYIEPQHYIEKLGARRSINELCNNGSATPLYTRGIARVDNKLFVPKFISIFDK